MVSCAKPVQLGTLVEFDQTSMEAWFGAALTGLEIETDASMPVCGVLFNLNGGPSLSYYKTASVGLFALSNSSSPVLNAVGTAPGAQCN